MCWTQINSGASRSAAVALIYKVTQGALVQSCEAPGSKQLHLLCVKLGQEGLASARQDRLQPGSARDSFTEERNYLHSYVNMKRPNREVFTEISIIFIQATFSLLFMLCLLQCACFCCSLRLRITMYSFTCAMESMSISCLWQSLKMRGETKKCSPDIYFLKTFAVRC